jgi:predicted nucleotidyltransferase
MSNVRHHMNRTPLLEAICADLIQNGHAHTILLYGSRANGTENEDSDYDIAAFGKRDEAVRDTRIVKGEYLDVFLYPESVLKSTSEDYLKLRQSMVLLQREHEADEFLANLEVVSKKGPKPLPHDEILARKTWAWKMALRLERRDVEGNYRRVWLLTALLEDYFAIRGRWFEGPKKSIQWLTEYDSITYSAFEAALQPGATSAAIRKAVERTVGGRPSA